MKPFIKILIICSIYFAYSCERQRNCKGVKGRVVFEGDIIEKLTDNCLPFAKNDEPLLITDSLELNSLYAKDTNYCKIKPYIDFNMYSIICFSYEPNCSSTGIKFDLVNTGNDEYKLNIYKCNKGCLSNRNIHSYFRLKTKKTNPNKFTYEIFN